MDVPLNTTNRNNEGLYDITVERKLREENLESPINIKCILSLPGTNYTKKKEAIYYGENFFYLFYSILTPILYSSFYTYLPTTTNTFLNILLIEHTNPPVILFCHSDLINFFFILLLFNFHLPPHLKIGHWNIKWKTKSMKKKTRKDFSLYRYTPIVRVPMWVILFWMIVDS